MTDKQVQIRNIASGTVISASPDAAARLVADGSYVYVTDVPPRFPAPPAGGPQVKIREIATGHVFLATPLDGREAVEHPAGGFEYAPADAAVTALNADGTVKAEPAADQQAGALASDVLDAEGNPLHEDGMGGWLRDDTGEPAAPVNAPRE